MTAQEQERRRALKRERRRLDSLAQEIAAAGKAARKTHAPSTRAKQAKRNHDVANAINQARASYEQMRQRMAAIAAELQRNRQA